MPDFLKSNHRTAEQNRTWFADSLKNYKDKMHSLYFQFRDLYKDLELHDEEIRRLSLPSPAFDEDYVQRSGGMHDLGTLIIMLEREQDHLKREKDEMFNELWLLKTSLERVWAAYQATRYDHYLILTELFVDQVKWEVLSAKYGWSRSTIKNKRQKALDEAIQIYNDESMSMEDLRKFGIRNFFQAKAKEESAKKGDSLLEGQMSLDSFLDD